MNKSELIKISEVVANNHSEELKEHLIKSITTKYKELQSQKGAIDVSELSLLISSEIYYFSKRFTIRMLVDVLTEAFPEKFQDI